MSSVRNNMDVSAVHKSSSLIYIDDCSLVLISVDELDS